MKIVWKDNGVKIVQTNPFCILSRYSIWHNVYYTQTFLIPPEFGTVAHHAMRSEKVQLSQAKGISWKHFPSSVWLILSKQASIGQATNCHALFQSFHHHSSYDIAMNAISMPIHFCASHLLIQVLLYSHPEVIEYAISIFWFGFLLIFPYDSISRSRRCNCAGGQSPRSLIPAKRDGEPSKAFTMVRVGLHSTQCPHGYGSWEVALFHGNHEKSRLVKYHQNNHGNQWNMVRGRVWHLPWRIGFERLLPWSVFTNVVCCACSVDTAR